jgi:hypothetical protein
MSDIDRQAKEEFYKGLTDKERIDTLILPCLMYHGIKALSQSGMEFRADILLYLERSMEATLSHVKSEGMRIKYAKAARDAAKQILDAMNPDNSVQALKAAALLIVNLAGQEVLVDQGSQAVLAALLVVQQAQQNHSGVWGPWIGNDLKLMVDRGLSTAQLLGHL